MALSDFVKGIGLGAGLMYFSDPVRGRRRRARVRDKASSYIDHSENAIGKILRDLANRVEGLSHEAGSVFSTKEAPAEVLVARVRSKMGHLVTHPGSIDADYLYDAGIALSGPVLADEVSGLISGVGSVPGVSRVENHLTICSNREDVPGLQGGPAQRPRERFELLQTNWSPAARFLVGSAGGVLALYAVRKPGFRGTLAGVVGGGMLARSITNQEFRALLGLGGVEIQKTLHIAAPVQRVFEFWANYENFPRFMSHLRDVRDTGHGRSHWIAAGPAGVPVEWDAEITELVPAEIIAWRSIPGSVVENAGRIRFQPAPDGGARLDVRISYLPPAGTVGHIVATLLGSDPKRAITDDLARLKSLLERGKTSVRGETVTRDTLGGVARTLVP